MYAHNACIPVHWTHSHCTRMRSLLSHGFQQLLRSISPPFCAVEPRAGFWAMSQQTASHLVCTELWTPQGENWFLVQEPSVFLCSRFCLCWVGPFVGNRASIVTNHFLALVTTVTGIGAPIPPSPPPPPVFPVRSCAEFWLILDCLEGSCIFANTDSLLPFPLVWRATAVWRQPCSPGYNIKSPGQPPFLGIGPSV